MSVYVDHFLNVPAIRLPVAEGDGAPDALSRAASVARPPAAGERAAHFVARYLIVRDALAPLAKLGHCCARTTTSTPSRSGRQPFASTSAWGRARTPRTFSSPAACYLAAHAPTAAVHEQTFRIALRLHRDERLYEDAT
jgi:hypothetical protein